MYLYNVYAYGMYRFRHVCGLGVGQWDYSTKVWRSKSTSNLTTFQGYNLELSKSFINIPFTYDAKNCSSLESMISFIEAKDHINGMDNRQTRMLAGALLEPHSPDSRTAEQL